LAFEVGVGPGDGFLKSSELIVVSAELLVARRALGIGFCVRALLKHAGNDGDLSISIRLRERGVGRGNVGADACACLSTSVSHWAIAGFQRISALAIT